MDKHILLIIYMYAKKNKVFGGVMRFAYTFSSAAFFLVYYAGAMYFAITDVKMLVPYTVTPFCILVVNRIIRKIVKRKRPFHVLTDFITVPENRKNSKSYSFPSNHSSSASAIAFACLLVSTPFGACAFVLAVITGLSRITQGVHYPSDVAAGFIISAVISIIGFSLMM
jgi:membrane-associated phospholipid phosphatase